MDSCADKIWEHANANQAQVTASRIREPLNTAFRHLYRRYGQRAQAKSASQITKVIGWRTGLPKKSPMSLRRGHVVSMRKAGPIFGWERVRHL
jgi:hypothetical protein